MEILIVAWIAFGIAGFFMADSRGRNTTVWALMGLFFGLLAIIVLAMMGKTDEKKAQDEAAQAARVAEILKK